jgi:hypothetical protein
MPLIRHDNIYRLSWGMLLIPLNLAFTVLLSYRLMWDDRAHDAIYWVFIACMWVDLILDFLTTVKRRLTVITSWKEVTRRYLRRWFVVDLLAAIPFEYIADVTQSQSTVLWVLRILPLLKAFKVAKVLHETEAHLDANPAIMRLTTFAYWFSQAVHLMAIGWVLVGGSPDEIETAPAKRQWVLKDGVLEEIAGEPEKRAFTRGEIYLRALYWTVTTVGTIGYGDYSPSKDNNVQIIYTIVIQIVGVSMYGYVVGNVSGLIANLDAARAAFNKRQEEVNDFMRVKRMPADMQARVRDYYEYIWETRHNVSDENVLRELPHTLAVDVLIHINKDILQKVEFFKNANEIFIREVVDMLTVETFLPEDYIIRQGEYGDCMYFLSSGTAEVLVNGNSVAKLGSGSPFGEMALVSGDLRMASIKALDYCDVYRLSREGFDRLRSRYAEFDERVKAVVEQRAQANRNKG